VDHLDMKINSTPFLLLPGVLLIGHLLGGWSNLAWWLGSWCAVVAAGTLFHIIRLDRLRAERDDMRKFVELSSSVAIDDV
jgi:hypothetical protein